MNIKNNFLREFVLFNAWGIIASVVQLLFFYILIKFNLFYLLATFISYWIAATIGYILNSSYTFNTFFLKKSIINKRYFKYLIVSFIGSLIDLLLVFIVINYFLGTSDSEQLISKIISICVVAILSFIGQKYYTFKQENL